MIAPRPATDIEHGAITIDRVGSSDEKLGARSPPKNEPAKPVIGKEDLAATSEPKLRWIVYAVVGVIILWLLNAAVGLYLDNDHRGVFGDTFGAVNALFSGLAFAGVTYAILMQRYEVALAKDDARATKKILDDQTAHLDGQNKHERKKSFEDTFFRMLSLLMDVSESVFYTSYSSQGVEHLKGRQAISAIADEIYNGNPWNSSAEVYELELDKFVKRYGANLSHYFRNVETLLVFITVSQEIDREFYAEIILGQLSDSEQKLLFHYSLSAKAERLKRLVERYHLLAGMDDDDVVLPELRDRFKLSAFEFTSSYVDEFLNVGWRLSRPQPPA